MALRKVKAVSFIVCSFFYIKGTATAFCLLLYIMTALQTMNASSAGLFT